MNATNLDVIATVITTALAVLLPVILISESSLPSPTRWRVAIGVGIWFTSVSTLAALHVFSAKQGIGTPLIGVAVVVPVVVAAAALGSSPTFQSLALGLPLTILVAVNIGRVLGAQFLLLHAMDRLPVTFALSAGWGDVLVGILALPLAAAVYRRTPGWRGFAWIWNILGTLDLLAAVTLGTGSAPGSPLRFIHESPDTGIMGDLPWLLIPGFLVPFYLITHLIVFRQLLSKTPHAGGRLAPLPDPGAP